jgi:hypothetical protein
MPGCWVQQQCRRCEVGIPFCAFAHRHDLTWLAPCREVGPVFCRGACSPCHLVVPGSVSGLSLLLHLSSQCRIPLSLSLC